MAESTLKLIELDGDLVSHASDYPYVVSCSHKKILFSLRSKKTYNFKPILIIDPFKLFDPVLPIVKGDSLKDQKIRDNCLLL